jgi:hypothetical protein
MSLSYVVNVERRGMYLVICIQCPTELDVPDCGLMDVPLAANTAACG